MQYEDEGDEEDTPKIVDHLHLGWRIKGKAFVYATNVLYSVRGCEREDDRTWSGTLWPARGAEMRCGPDMKTIAVSPYAGISTCAVA